MPGEQFGSQGVRELEMAVRVIKPDGRSYCEVAEKDLEPYGFGRGPLAAVERYRAERNKEAQEDGRESWDTTRITIKPDEALGHPFVTFRLVGEIVFRTTRWQKALREIAAGLIEVANGGELPEAIRADMQVQEVEESE